MRARTHTYLSHKHYMRICTRVQVFDGLVALTGDRARRVSVRALAAALHRDPEVASFMHLPVDIEQEHLFAVTFERRVQELTIRHDHGPPISWDEFIRYLFGERHVEYSKPHTPTSLTPGYVGGTLLPGQYNSALGKESNFAGGIGGEHLFYPISAPPRTDVSAAASRFGRVDSAFEPSSRTAQETRPRPAVAPLSMRGSESYSKPPNSRGRVSRSFGKSPELFIPRGISPTRGMPTAAGAADADSILDSAAHSFAGINYSGTEGGTFRVSQSVHELQRPGRNGEVSIDEEFLARQGVFSSTDGHDEVHRRAPAWGREPERGATYAVERKLQETTGADRGSTDKSKAKRGRVKMKASGTKKKMRKKKVATVRSSSYRQ